MSEEIEKANIAVRIIAKFGGIRPMARIINRPTSTVQSWEQSGYIPARQQENILQSARAFGIELTPADFFSNADAAE